MASFTGCLQLNPVIKVAPKHHKRSEKKTKKKITYGA